LCGEASAVLRHTVKLDLDLKQIRQEREYGSKRKHARKEDDEAELDDCLIVEVDKGCATWSHDELLFGVLMHRDFFASDRIILVYSFERCFVASLDLFDLASNEDFIHEPLDDVQTYLFTDHDDNQVRGELSEIADPIGNNVVGDVRVNELEHVHLINETIFESLLVAMVL